jgi:hypothetical protein
VQAARMPSFEVEKSARWLRRCTAGPHADRLSEVATVQKPIDPKETDE